MYIIMFENTKKKYMFEKAATLNALENVFWLFTCVQLYVICMFVIFYIYIFIV